jgi:hypothetical protein
MNKTPLTQRLGEGLLDRGDQAGRAVGDDQQRAGQAAAGEIGEEVRPGVGGLGPRNSVTSASSAACISSCAPSRATSSKISWIGLS